MPDARPTTAAVHAFRAAFLTLCREHGLSIEHYLIEYDEYDSDEGYEIVPLDRADQFFKFETMELKR